MKKLFFLLSFTFLGTVYAQDAIEYKTPPKEIFDLVMAKPSPGVSIDTKGEWMLIMERSAMPSIEELASRNKYRYKGRMDVNYGEKCHAINRRISATRITYCWVTY